MFSKLAIWAALAAIVGALPTLTAPGETKSVELVCVEAEAHGYATFQSLRTRGTTA